MIGAVVCGLLVAAGVWAILRGMFPAPVRLSRMIADFQHPADFEATEIDRLKSAWSRASVRVVGSVQNLDGIRPDLAVVGMLVEEFATDKLKAGVLGSVIVGGWFFALRIAGGPLLLIALLAGFVGFFFYPDALLRKKATARRRELVDTVTAFVGLVSVSIAGGGGVMSAMNAAVSLGDGWALERLRFVLDRAATSNESPWTALDRLGSEFGVPALVELGGSMSLAGQAGARVSDSLAARARAAKARELAERLAQEERKSEVLGVPVVLMLLGWIGFLGYPAIANLIEL